MIKINEAIISETSQRARQSGRRRMNFNFHKEDDASLQRMLNALEPDTYIQPHKHEDPDKVEVFFVLRGRILVLEFDDEGNITEHIVLDPKCGDYGSEIAPQTWHTIICLDAGSVAYEVKDGPYNVANDKNFALWAPTEGDENCEIYNADILKRLGLKP